MKIDSVYDEGSSREDAYLIKGNIFAVFDGFNSLDRFVDRNDKTGGAIASSIAKEVFSRNSKDFRSLAIEANREIRERMIAEKIDLTRKTNLWGTAAAAVRINESSFEWMQISDCLIMVIYKNGSSRLLVDEYNHDKEVMVEWKKLANQKKENIRALVEKSVEGLRKKVNEAYGALNGDERAISFINAGTEDLAGVKHILLFTDGLFIPKEDLAEEDDWNLFAKLFLEGGLKNIRNYVRKLEREDPKCWKYPRYKQYDDIAAISISF